MQTTELAKRKHDAAMVLELLKGISCLTFVEACAKQMAEFIRDLPMPAKAE